MAQHGCIQFGCQLQLKKLPLLTLSLNLLLLRRKSQSSLQVYFLSLLHLFSHGDLDALDVQRTPYTIWHMAYASTCALPEWLHLAFFATLCPSASLVS